MKSRFRLRVQFSGRRWFLSRIATAFVCVGVFQICSIEFSILYLIALIHIQAKLSNIASEVTKLEKRLNEENRHKSAKEEEGRKYIKEAREELQKLSKVLLQKKLENEDMKAEVYNKKIHSNIA